MARRQDRSLAQSLRSHSLELYLKKFADLFLEPESVDVLKLFDHCPEIFAIYRQLSIQLISDKDYGWQRENHDAGLAQVSIISVTIIIVVNETICVLKANMQSQLKSGGLPASHLNTLASMSGL